MELEAVQQHLFESLAQVGQALSSAPRLRILGLLAQGENSVEALAERTGQPIANASAHLQALKTAHLVQARRDGRRIFYSLNSDAVLRFWLSLRELGVSELPELRELVREHFQAREAEHLSPEQLLEEVERGRLVLLDLRPADEYAAGHIPGARSIPAAELRDRLSSLPRRKEIAIYCRGPYCIAALEGERVLQEAGLKVRRLPLGVPEWRAASMPLESDALSYRHPES